jgi:hypothetical protein
MFHRGADILGDSRRCVGRATWRYMQFKDAAAVEALKPELQAIVRAWCEPKQK